MTVASDHVIHVLGGSMITTYIYTAGRLQHAFLF